MSDDPTCRIGSDRLTWRGQSYFVNQDVRSLRKFYEVLSGAGVAGNHDGMTSVIDAIPQGRMDERPVILFDQLGCGRSDHPDDPTLWTIPRFVQEVQAVRAALGYKEIHLLGHSWGTLLAYEYLLTKPVGVKSVIMSGPAISIVRFRHDVDSMIALLPDSLIKAIRTNEKAGTTTAPAYLAASQVFYDRHVIRTKPLPADVDSTFKGLGQQVYNTMNGPTEFTVVGSFKDYDGTPRLRELTLPVLWMAGEFDETSPSAAKDFQRMVPGSQYVEFKGAGHMTMYDARVEFLKAVRGFLKANE